LNQPTDIVLEVKDLEKSFPSGSRTLLGRRAGIVVLKSISFFIRRGETLGLVGESGSGKSTIARAVTMLSPPTAGSVRIAGEEITTLSPAKLRLVRRQVQIIFQDPFSALDPRMRVGNAVEEPLTTLQPSMGRRERDAYVAELFRRTGLDPATRTRFPHEFSGGQRQRICIARAIALKPDLIVADEPVSSLDVSIQAQVLNLLLDLQKDFNLTYLFISHDLNVVRNFCDRVAVIYRGQIVESASTRTIFSAARHPYTQALLAAAPVADPRIERAKVRQRSSVRFEPGADLQEVSPGHWVRSWS